MKNLSIILCIPLCALVMIGCTKTEFVVLRDVPPKPSFQVVPTYLDPFGISYANNIERALIGSGVKVFLRPMHKEVKTEKVLPESKVIENPMKHGKLNILLNMKH